VATEARIGLLDAEPDLGRFLSEEERDQAARVAVVVKRLRGDFQLHEILGAARAFGAVILDGMVVQSMQLGEQLTLRLTGPGDLLSAAGTGSQLVFGSGFTAVAETRIGLLDDRVLVAGQRWPRLFAALQLKSAEQSERIALQLAICQLPRVTERLLGLLWLLSETWGRVTSSGVVVPVSLTHDALGGMIGARRPTVTLALGELSDRGAIVRQDLGWLLLERIPAPLARGPMPDAPTLFEHASTVWSAPPDAALASMWNHAELLESITRLRAEHQENRERVRERLDAVRATRDQVRERRAEFRKLSRRRVPSS
jgi:CRP-like cAMP-binding protein